MAVVVKWDDLSGIPVLNYNVYRSTIGFEVEPGPYGFYPGDTFVFELTYHGVQYIHFIADFETTVELCNYINSRAKGATALPNKDNDGFIFRADQQSEEEYMIIHPSSVAVKWNQTPRQISFNSEKIKIGEVDPAPIVGEDGEELPPPTAFEYEDRNGIMYDWYAISSTSMGSVESQLSELVLPSAATGDMAYIHGMLIDLQGVRIVDAKVSARIVQPPEESGFHSIVSVEEVHTLSKEDGSFTLPILQGTDVYFLINDVRVSDTVTVPYKSHVYWDNLPIYPEYETGTW